MVGIDKIREYLGDFNANYLIIGGTACNLNLEEAELQGRATKDIDMIVVCEAINAEYVQQFWAFIKAGGYKVCPVSINTDGEAKVNYYRFIEPADAAFPVYIELFSKVPDGIQIPEDAHLVHIDMDEDYLSGFSAILLDDDYYNYAIAHSREIDGIQVLDKDALVVLKAKAYLNNKKRKEDGQQVHQDDIDKHKKDIYRISFLFSGEERYDVTAGMKEDLNGFLIHLSTNTVSTKAIAKAMGVVEVSMLDFVQKIKDLFQL
ncbi:MAG: hypothetical protein LBR97_00510 [Dysgonamonadaceae bacterium]|jgi:hypothetical protein|nr:hypothetical protein [Dysgonamonadaceae bacterium]